MTILSKIVVGEIKANCYIVGCEETKKAVIIDPGAEPEKIRKVIEEKNLKPEIIINTHGHIDHILANDAFNLPVYIHRLDVEFLKDPDKNLSAFFAVPYTCNCETKLLEDGDIIKVGKLNFTVIHTPGHTPGGICLKLSLCPLPRWERNIGEGENVVFSGDTLFCNGVGRTDFTGGSEEKLFKSIREKLFILSDDTIIYPGHGPSSTIGREKPHF